MTDEELFQIYLGKVKEMIRTHPKLKKDAYKEYKETLKKQVEFRKNRCGDAVPITNIRTKMIEKETTYKLTLTEIEAIKLLRLLDTIELWDNDLESIYYEMKESVDTEKFNRLMETVK